MSEQQIVWSSVEALRARLASGSLDAGDVVEAFLTRIERLDPKLQAYSVVWPERARARAAVLDEARRGGRPLGPLHGVAVALKDLCDVAGEPTRAGTIALGSTPAAENAEVVDRLEAAGAIVLGKLKMTEGAFVEHHPSVTPPVNPWNPGRWTGISSSGSGVAVAAGLCTLALGTDTGGSIRYPSAACGLSGLKPTHGRISLRGVFPLCDSLDHIGPMARSAEDAAIAFRVLAGHDPRDPWSLAINPVPAPLPDAPAAAGARIGYDPHYAEEGVDAFVRDALRSVLEVYRGLGADVVEFTLPDHGEALAAWVQLGSAEMARAHADSFAAARDRYGPALAAAIEAGLAAGGIDVSTAWRSRIAFARRLEGCFVAGAASCPPAAPAGLDAILAPVIPGAFPAGANLGRPDTIPFGPRAIEFTSPFNLAGVPCFTLCGGFDAEGAPIGFQLVGAHLDESRLLELGAAYQAATDHHLRRPGGLD